MQHSIRMYRQCGTVEAAHLTQDEGLKKLVLVHIGPELAKHGAVIFSEELMSLPLTR